MRASTAIGFLAALAAGYGIASARGLMSAEGPAPTAAPANAPTAGSTAARFHHVHLNVTDAEATMDYYEKFFGANRTLYHDAVDALFTERSFILMNVVPRAPENNFGTTFWHIGWAGVDGQSEFDWRVAEGIGVQTPITPLGRNHFMYFWGPDEELVEVYTGSRNHRFEHVHLLATDIDSTLAWFRDHLGLEPNGPVRTLQETDMRLNTIRVDNVNLIMFEVPGPGEEPAWLLPEEIGPDFAVTDGRAMDHVAFSFDDIRPVRDRLAAAGVEIVRDIATDPVHGLTSFFVRGPDGLLVEIVEEAPVPEGIWR